MQRNCMFGICRKTLSLLFAGALGATCFALSAMVQQAFAQTTSERFPQYCKARSLEPVTGKAIVIRLSKGTLCLSAGQASKKGSSRIRVSSFSNTASARFRIIRSSKNIYRIISLSDSKALTCTKHKTKISEGAAVRTAAFKNKKNQLWHIKCVNKKKGLFSFSPLANPKLKLRTRADYSHAGAKFAVGKKRAGYTRTFTVYAPQAQIPDGSYGLTDSQSTSLALHIAEYRQRSIGTRLILAKRESNNSFNFVFSYHADTGYYTLKNRRSKLFLDAGSSKSATCFVSQQKRASKPQQWWYLVHEATGGYRLCSAKTGHVVSLSNNQIGTYARMRTRTSSKNSLWSIRPANCYNTSHNCGYKLNIIDDEGTDEAYHPKVVAFTKAWNGYRYWMAYTPYPTGNATYEDPYLVASNDLITWETPKGVSNPLDDTRQDGVYGTHNSDTHLLYNEKKEQLELYWRWVDSKRAVIYRMTSKDGHAWSARQTVCATDDRIGGNEFISPALVCENGKYKMWYVGSQRGNVLYRESDDGVTWSKPRTIVFPFSYSEMKVWHIDVEKTSKGYEAVFAAYDEWDNRNRMCLWYSKSKTGTDKWSTPTIIIRPTTGSNRWDNMGIYRSCLCSINGHYVVFYGGTSRSYHHGLGIMYGNEVTKLKGPDVNFADPACAAAFARELATYLKS